MACDLLITFPLSSPSTRGCFSVSTKSFLLLTLTSLFSNSKHFLVSPNFAASLIHFFSSQFRNTGLRRYPKSSGSESIYLHNDLLDALKPPSNLESILLSLLLSSVALFYFKRTCHTDWGGAFLSTNHPNWHCQLHGKWRREISVPSPAICIFGSAPKLPLMAEALLVPCEEIKRQKRVSKHFKCLWSFCGSSSQKE